MCLSHKKTHRKSTNRNGWTVKLLLASSASGTFGIACVSKAPLTCGRCPERPSTAALCLGFTFGRQCSPWHSNSPFKLLATVLASLHDPRALNMLCRWHETSICCHSAFPSEQYFEASHTNTNKKIERNSIFHTTHSLHSLTHIQSTRTHLPTWLSALLWSSRRCARMSLAAMDWCTKQPAVVVALVIVSVLLDVHLQRDRRGAKRGTFFLRTLNVQDCGLWCWQSAWVCHRPQQSNSLGCRHFFFASSASLGIIYHRSPTDQERLLKTG